MNPDEYTKMYELEDHYWWFVGRRHLAINLLRRHLPEVRHPLVLDLGCGTGVVSSELKRFSKVVSLDMSELALSFCQKRELGWAVQGDGTQLPLMNSSFEGLIGLDIFEHIDDHEAAFREAFRVLKPGGVLVLSVPAFMSLWGPHDVALHHFRRYRRLQVSGQLRAAGFDVVRCSYSVFFLFPLVVMTRFVEKRRRGPAKASLPPVPGWMNRSLAGLQRVEAGLIGRTSLPWGSSVVAVARKPIS